jgi:catechol 2,3-dioxygenase-like lactoylglutathione lyase family enzyme
VGIERIESVTYAVDDLDECARFFGDLGLTLRDHAEPGAEFVTLVGQTLVVRRDADPWLPRRRNMPPPSPRSSSGRVFAAWTPTV